MLSRKHLIDVDTVLHHTKTIHGWCDESKLDELRSFDFVESVEVDKRRPVLALPTREKRKYTKRKNAPGETDADTTTKA